MPYFTTDVYKGTKQRVLGYCQATEIPLYTIKAPETHAKGYWAANLTHPITGEEKSLIVAVGRKVKISAEIGQWLFVAMAKTNNMTHFLSKLYSLDNHGFSLIRDEDLIRVEGTDYPALLFTYNHDLGCWQKARVTDNTNKTDKAPQMLPVDESKVKNLLSIPNRYTDNGMFRTRLGTDYILRSDHVPTSNGLAFVKASKRQPSQFEAVMLSGSYKSIPEKLRIKDVELAPYSPEHNYHLDTVTKRIYYTPKLVTAKIKPETVLYNRASISLDFPQGKIGLPFLEATTHQFLCGEVMLAQDAHRTTCHFYDYVAKAAPTNRIKFLINEGLLELKE